MARRVRQRPSEGWTPRFSAFAGVVDRRHQLRRRSREAQVFFPDLLESEAQRREYERVCADFGDFCQECSLCLVQAWNAAHEAAGQSGQEYHANVLALARHVIESVDGVSLMVSKGGSYACQPLLRSALEATLGVLYILESDTERRALAYAVCHAHKRIKLYDRLDPTTQAGQEFRRLLDGDMFEDFFNKLPLIDYPARIAGLQAMFARAEYVPIEAEWQRLKAAHPRRQDPDWYSLFGGPKNVRELAIRLKYAGMYELLYRFWSDEVHAGNALESFGQKDGDSVWRPVRHPEQLQAAVQQGTSLALHLARRLVEVYAPAKWPELQARYKERVSARANQLAKGRVIQAPWKDTAF
jgi:hypothetical protein